MEVLVNDFKNAGGTWVKSYYSGVQYRTRSYRKWNSMRQRCRADGSCQKNCSAYIGCSMSDNFKDFQYFVDWSIEQIGYGIGGYDLEKDILLKGNKVYSESTCVFVPQPLNLFLVASDAIRGEWPQGVSFHKHSGKYRADIKINGKGKSLGIYTTPEQAFAVYKKAKEAEAYRWYERLKAGEFVVDERVIERMRTWTFDD